MENTGWIVAFFFILCWLVSLARKKKKEPATLAKVYSNLAQSAIMQAQGQHGFTQENLLVALKHLESEDQELAGAITGIAVLADKEGLSSFHTAILAGTTTYSLLKIALKDHQSKR